MVKLRRDETIDNEGKIRREKTKKYYSYGVKDNSKQYIGNFSSKKEAEIYWHQDDYILKNMLNNREVIIRSE